MKNSSPLHRFTASVLLRFSLFLILASTAIHGAAQTTTQWKIDGNTVSSDSKLGTNSGYDLIIETNNAERLRVTDGGFVGIGLNNPDSKLHLIGDFKIIGNIKLGNWEDSNISESRYAYVDGDGILKSGSTNKMLQDIYRDDCKIFPGAIYPAPVWASQDGENYGVLYTASSCPARVGIGTNTPFAELDVVGKIRSTQAVHIGSQETMDTGYKLRISTVGPVPKNIFNISNQGEIESRYLGNTQNPFAIKLGDSEVNLFSISPQGTIDLNLNAPMDGTIVFKAHSIIDNKDILVLTSDGKVYCQGIVVKHAPFWGDFVFEKGYHKMSLSDLEKYIEANKHLPEIPAAAEIAENGVDVYDMIRLLTIKVEELTLYTIEQQKEIEALKENTTNK